MSRRARKVPSYCLHKASGKAVVRLDGPTTIEFIIRGPEIVIQQDVKRLATTTLSGHLAEQLGKVKGLGNVKWGDGTYGRFAGKAIKGSIHRD